MITDAVKIALIVAVPSVITAAGGVYLSFLGLMKKTDADRQAMMNQVSHLEIKVDGRLTELLEAKDDKEKATALSSHAEGVLEEKNRQENNK